MGLFRPAKLFLYQDRGGSWGGEHYVPQDNIYFQEGPAAPPVLQSISISPSPGVVYITTSQPMQFSPSGHIENSVVVKGAVLFLV